MNGINNCRACIGILKASPLGMKDCPFAAARWDYYKISIFYVCRPAAGCSYYPVFPFLSLMPKNVKSNLMIKESLKDRKQETENRRQIIFI